jgi:hypothetical protein
MLPNVKDNLAYDDGFDEKTGVYDEAFLQTANCRMVPPTVEGARLFPGARTPDSIAQEAKEEASDAQHYTYIVPTRFEHGDHMETYLIGERPMALGLLSNATFKDLKPGQQAQLGVAAARFDNDRIDFTLLNFEILNQSQARNLPELLRQARLTGKFEQDYLLPPELTGRQKITISLENRTIVAESAAKASPCYLVRGRTVYEISGLGLQELQSGDIILAMTPGLLKGMVRQVTSKAYGEVVPALQNPTGEAMAELPEDFLQLETANQIIGLLKNCQYEAKILSEGEEEEEVINRLSTQKLFRTLTSLYHRQLKQSNPDDQIVTDAFIAYQVP